MFQKNKELILRNLGKDGLVMLFVRVFVRILGISNMILFLNHIGEEKIYGLNGYYSSLSLIYYILFFVFLDWYLKTVKGLFNKGLFMEPYALKWVNYLKWIPLVLTISLLAMSVGLIDFVAPEQTYRKIIHFTVKFLPALLGKNTSFILITMLIFYSCAILNVNKKLKEEQDLTI